MERMTRKQAKELSLKKWAWLKDNPTRRNLPKYMEKEFKLFKSGCPLCTLYSHSAGMFKCGVCPIDRASQNCFEIGSWFDNLRKRKKIVSSTKAIYECIENWKI